MCIRDRIKIGITGGIGSGKSMVSRLLEVLGVPVYISDLDYKYLLKRNEIDLLSEVSLYLPNARSKNKINRYKIFIQTHQPKTCLLYTSLTEFNIRKLQMLVKRGENQEALNNLSKCMLCGKCLLVCPRGVDTRKMILTLIQYLRK